MTQQEKAQQFADLHVKGNPIILYNAWDGGSARTIMGAGAKAIASGDHPVGFAHGYTDDDFDEFEFDSYLATIKDILRVVGDLPYSVDISNGTGLSDDELKSRVTTLLELGVVGINFEDRLDDSSGVLPIDEQVRKIKAIREAADAAGVPLFINARTDLFSTSEQDTHADHLAEAIERAEAYKNAGANGFFTPFLNDISLITELAKSIELPLNIIKLPQAPTTSELATANVARISYGPIPQLQMTDWLKERATSALTGKV